MSQGWSKRQRYWCGAYSKLCVRPPMGQTYPTANFRFCDNPQNLRARAGATETPAWPAPSSWQPEASPNPIGQRWRVSSSVRRSGAPLKYGGSRLQPSAMGCRASWLFYFTSRTDLPSDEWKEAVNNVIDRMFAHYEPNTAFGFQNQEVNLQSLDDPSLQTGAAGVALVLLAASGMLGEAWDAVFLLA